MKTVSSILLSVLLVLPVMAKAAEPRAKTTKPAAPTAVPVAKPAATAAPEQEGEAATEEAPATSEATPPTSTEAIPTPAAWVKELQEKGTLKSRGKSVYPSTILVLEETPKEGFPIFSKVNPLEFAKLGYLRTPSTKELDFFFAINKRPNMKDQKISKTPEQWLTILLDGTSGDTVLFMHKKGPWELIQSKDDKPQVALAKPGAKATDAASVHKWLIGLLGYEGVILDRKGSHFLVGTLQNVQKKDTQALIIKDSHDKFALTDATSDGAGLLQLVSHESGFGVFELLVGDKPETIPNGTKIMIEKKKEKAAPADTAPSTESEGEAEEE